MSLKDFESSLLCVSNLGAEINLYRRQSSVGSRLKVLLIAVMHGDEPEGAYLMDHFVEEKLYKDVSDEVDLYLIPRLNPDGFKAQTRVNGAKVDLNRNFPTKDWSPEFTKDRYNPGIEPGKEPESKALIEFLSNNKIDFLINFHAWNPMVNYNGDCRDLAKIMSKLNKCPVTSDMGYPTPGSSGTWFWEALKIPSITLEIKEGSTKQEVLSQHPQALTTTINAATKKYSL